MANSLKIQFLGTGTSTGVPEIGCQCSVCKSTDKRDNRLRCSALITVEGKRILIDCGPDFREQMLKIEFGNIDALLITHEHYDHVAGLDDLRPFSKEKNIHIYTNSTTKEALETRVPYCFTESKYLGVPSLVLTSVASDKPFRAAGIDVQAINIMHHNLSIYGYRIGNLAYLTDVKSIPESEYDKLEDLDLLVLDALHRTREHISHQNLAQALAQIERIAPKRTYLIHMSHRMGLHANLEAILPKNVFLAYDGLEISI